MVKQKEGKHTFTHLLGCGSEGIVNVMCVGEKKVKKWRGGEVKINRGTGNLNPKKKSPKPTGKRCLHTHAPRQKKDL